MAFLTEKEIYTYLIDHRNKELWEYLKEKFVFSINDDYQIYKLDFVENDPNVCILVDKNYNIPLFTHELMHLELRSHNINTLLGFKDVLLEDGTLSYPPYEVRI